MNLSTNQNIKRGGVFAVLLCSSLAVTSCAMAPTAPLGAENVRNKLTALQENPNLADRARMELREAEVAVRIAEQPLSEADAALGQHRVYMADRTVAIAEAKATTRYAEDQRAELGEERDAARLKARTLEVDKARDDASTARAAAEAAQRSQAEAAAVAVQQEAEYQRRIAALQAEVTDRGVVLTLGDVLFATGSAEIQEGASSKLNRLVDFLNQYPERNAHIEGHTDNVGGADYNLRLSQHRADAVRHYLMQQGVASQRLSTSGLGMDRPVANNDTPTGRQQNRRVEIIVENPS